MLACASDGSANSYQTVSQKFILKVFQPMGGKYFSCQGVSSLFTFQTNTVRHQNITVISKKVKLNQRSRD